jgi:hypothetical protein
MPATTPDNRPAALNLRPHKQRPCAAVSGSFKLTRRKLTFTQPPSQPMQPAPLALAPSHIAHETHAAHDAFRALCLCID